jgi:hypothetical protein
MLNETGRTCGDCFGTGILQHFAPVFYLKPFFGSGDNDTTRDAKKNTGQYNQCCPKIGIQPHLIYNISCFFSKIYFYMDLASYFDMFLASYIFTRHNNAQQCTTRHNKAQQSTTKYKLVNDIYVVGVNSHRVVGANFWPNGKPECMSECGDPHHILTFLVTNVVIWFRG